MAETQTGTNGDDIFISDGVETVLGMDGIDTVDFSGLGPDAVEGAFEGIIVDLDVNSAGAAGTPSQDGAVLGTIGVLTIEQGARMLPLGGGMYVLPGNAAAPQPATDPKVKQGFVENSNVEAVLEMTRLIDIQRAYENSVKLMNQDDDLTKNAIQRLGRST